MRLTTKGNTDMSRYHSSNRFNNYRQIQARRAETATCGHPIKVGDTIGWNKQHGTKCSACWIRWSDENAEAEMMESGYGPCCY